MYKIARDEQGNRLSYMKITGGTLKVKDLLTTSKGNVAAGEEIWEEKADQIRIYSGAKFELAERSKSGNCLCRHRSYPHISGQGLGITENSNMPVLEPVLNYRILLPEGCDVHQMLKKLKELEEEDPQLHIVWDEQLGEIHAMLMGDVQIEILKRLIWERFHVAVDFGTGNIVYKKQLLRLWRAWDILSLCATMRRYICFWSQVSREAACSFSRRAARMFWTATGSG